MQKNETRPPTYIIHNNKFQMAKRLTNVSREIIKMVEENISSKISGNVCSNVLSDTSPQARETKEK